MLNFKILENGIISNQFLENNITNFTTACNLIANLPYKRNRDKDNLVSIFIDNGGTCSTKHAVLKKLALENNHPEVKLILGIFKMDSIYAPVIKNTLEKYDLKYIPEAHNYLKIENEYYDFTKENSNYNQFRNELIFETEIEYDEITHHKIEIHKKYLKDWLKQEKLPYSLDQIWEIREKCIQDLQSSTI